MKRQRRPGWCRCERRLDDPCSNVRERCCNARQAKGTYQQENSLAEGLRPRGAAGVLLCLPCGGRGVVWGPLVGAGPVILQLVSEAGILSVGLAPKRDSLREVLMIVEI
jgi:hypothetical protein